MKKYVLTAILLCGLNAQLWAKDSQQYTDCMRQGDAAMGVHPAMVKCENAERKYKMENQKMKEQFTKWFEVVYRDNPDEVENIVSIWQDMVDDEEATWSGDEIFTDSLLHNELGDGAHFFAIDWKDADTLIDYLDDVAERFDFKFQWTNENREQDSVENLLPLAVAQLNKHGVLFYSLETDGDLYYFVAIPKADKQDFERVSQQWGVEYTLL